MYLHRQSVWPGKPANRSGKAALQVLLPTSAGFAESLENKALPTMSAEQFKPLKKEDRHEFGSTAR
jgi:hypothetical protein